MTILPPKKLLYRDAFNSPSPNLFYPCRITNPSKLAILCHRIRKRCRLQVSRILVLLLIGPMSPQSGLTDQIRGKEAVGEDQVGDGYVGSNCGSARNSLLMYLAEANLLFQHFPYLHRRWPHGLLLAIPKARPFVSFFEREVPASLLIFVLKMVDAPGTVSTVRQKMLQRPSLQAIHDAFVPVCTS